jgi:Kef-type K+ transport system membrane component KefB/mannitol/fructose-specific phosphotransferase system IIA component (Ntr-type)
MKRRISILVLVLVCAAPFLFAQESEAPSLTHAMASLVIQLGLILFAAKIFGILAGKVKLPPVLGELIAGIIIGPYALGAIGIPGFPHGLFPAHAGAMAVSPELYAFATVASILLLFVSGLETDIGLFLRYSFAGFIVGLGGVVFSFVLGDLAGVFLLHLGPFDPGALFMGILSTATSVGITARILSDQRKMDSPEGVTILSAAVIDDVLGIICLAVVMGLAAIRGDGASGGVGWGKIAGIAAKALGTWLGFTALGLLFSKQLSRFLKVFRLPTSFSVLALGLAFLLAGFFEMEGLAMIIGAYIIGLSLSKSDIALVIREKIHTLYDLFVPIFFAVMGMLVNPRILADPKILAVGGVYTLLAIVAKIIGCGLPSLALGFNPKGALRIGLGMIPRGEVALIIAGIGLASGYLDESVFGIAILMTLVTTVFTPPVLGLALRIPGAGTKKPVRNAETVSTSFALSGRDIADLVMDTFLRELESEGFWIQLMNVSEGISQVRKGDIALSIEETDEAIRVESSPEDLPFVRRAFYETLLKVEGSIERLKSDLDPAQILRDSQDGAGRANDEMAKHLRYAAILPRLKARDKDAAILELVDALARSGDLKDRDGVLRDVMARERSMSTGMQDGVALPHGKTDGVEGLRVALGISREGIEFGSLDGKPARLIFLVVSPRKTSGPHVQLLAAIGTLLKDKDRREALASADTEPEARRLIWESGEPRGRGRA